MHVRPEMPASTNYSLVGSLTGIYPGARHRPGNTPPPKPGIPASTPSNRYPTRQYNACI